MYPRIEQIQVEFPHISAENVRYALRDWISSKELGNNPLAALKIVQQRVLAAGNHDSPVKRAVALRGVLQEALEALRPDAGEPDYSQKRWRAYIILAEQYLHGRNPEWIQNQLFISKGTYFSEQKRALEALTDILGQWEEAARATAPRRQDKMEAQTAYLPETSIPFLAPPLPPYPLVGHQAALDEIKQRLFSNVDQALTALNGLPGVGKTTLAVALAHDAQVQAYFCDGILWAGLGRQPDALAWLDTWAAALGVPSDIISACADLAGRAALVHKAIGTRRMLLVIDDVWQSEAALALKVGGARCAHLITTRLPQVALDFAGNRITMIHELSVDEGLKLLEQFSALAVQFHPEKVRQLVNCVGGLPLALVLMGRYLQKQSHAAQERRLSQALSSLQIAGERLNLAQPQSPLETHPDFAPGTPLSLQTVIGLSDAALDERARRALACLAILPPKPNSFSEEAALAITDAAVEVLDQLVDCGLIESATPDRYTIHQTIADFARNDHLQADVITRLVDYFRQYLALHPGNYRLLDVELNNIIYAVEAGLKAGLYTPIVDLVNVFLPYLEQRGLYQISEHLLQPVYQLACTHEDQPTQAFLLFEIGDLQVRRGQFKEAKLSLHRALELIPPKYDNMLKANTLFQLGLSCLYSNDIPSGEKHLEEGLEVSRRNGFIEMECFTLSALGWNDQERGRYDRALAHLEESLQRAISSSQAGKLGSPHSERIIGFSHFNLSLVYLPRGDFSLAQEHAERTDYYYHQIGDRRGIAWLVYHNGRIARQMGRYDEALRLFTQALEMMSEIGDWMGHGFSLHNVGLVRSEMGEDAENIFKQALEIFSAIECQGGVAQCYRSLSILYYHRKDYPLAQSYAEQNLSLARQCSFNRGESKAMAILALIFQRLGKPQQAIQSARQALKITQEIGARPSQAFTLTCLGRVLAEQGQPEEAQNAFTRALAIRQEAGQTHLLAEPLAGLASLAWQSGDLAAAQDYTTRIAQYLSQPGLFDPAWVRQVYEGLRLNNRQPE